MFALISGLFRWLLRREEIKMLILGIDNAGKSTTLERMKIVFQGRGLPSSSIPPTVGLNMGRVKVGDIDAVFWDLGGQMALRSIWEKYYDDSDAVLFVVDSTDADRIEEARDCLSNVLGSDSLAHRAMPVVVLANKQDLTSRALDVEELRKFLELEKLRLTEMGLRREVHILPGSALNGTNIESAVRLVVQAAKDHRATGYRQCHKNSFRMSSGIDMNNTGAPLYAPVSRAMGSEGIPIQSVGATHRITSEPTSPPRI